MEKHTRLKCHMALLYTMRHDSYVIVPKNVRLEHAICSFFFIPFKKVIDFKINIISLNQIMEPNKKNKKYNFYIKIYKYLFLNS